MSEYIASTAVSPVPAVSAPSATAATAPSTENGFERFFDKLVPFLKKTAPVVLEGAELARPLLALTPIGSEYNIVLTAIETAVQADQAVQAAAGTALTGPQKMAVAISVATPQLTTILGSKGITLPAAVQAAIAQFAQNVYNFQLGPAAKDTK